MIQDESVNQAIAYIMEHIEEEITIEQVAEHCHFSKYHFSRMFKQATNESLYSFIKRRKIEQSAFRIKVERDKKITDIGYDYGYSPSNFSTAFHQYYEVSPVVFRKQINEYSMSYPYNEHVKNQIESFEDADKKITIETLYYNVCI